MKKNTDPAPTFTPIEVPVVRDESFHPIYAGGIPATPVAATEKKKPATGETED